MPEMTRWSKPAWRSSGAKKPPILAPPRRPSRGEREATQVRPEADASVPPENTGADNGHVVGAERSSSFPEAVVEQADARSRAPRSGSLVRIDRHESGPGLSGC